MSVLFFTFQDHPNFAVRRISSIELRPSICSVLPCNTTRASKDFHYWELELTGKSFLYRQVLYVYINS